LPLHRQLYLLLREGLERGAWAVGEQLPTEHELARTYGCSLITVRRALGDLAREHRVTRTPGRGTFAAEVPEERNLSSITSFTDEMKERGLDPHTTVLEFDVRRVSASASRLLRVAGDTDVYYLERLRSSGETPMILEQVEIPVSLAPGLDVGFQPATSSLYRRLHSVYGLELTQGEEFIEPGLPDERTAALLGQPKSQPVLFLKLIAYSTAGTPIEYCRSAVRGDQARYRLDVLRPTQRPLPTAGN